jgi:hypothetical protein
VIAEGYAPERASVLPEHDEEDSMIRNLMVVAIATGAALTLQADDDVSRRDQVQRVHCFVPKSLWVKKR